MQNLTFAKIGKDIHLYNCKNYVAYVADESNIGVQGLDGNIVSGKHGQLLVCSLKEEQRIYWNDEYWHLFQIKK